VAPRCMSRVPAAAHRRTESDLPERASGAIVPKGLSDDDSFELFHFMIVGTQYTPASCRHVRVTCTSALQIGVSADRV
jgi:hypothetical protein